MTRLDQIISTAVKSIEVWRMESTPQQLQDALEYPEALVFKVIEEVVPVAPRDMAELFSNDWAELDFEPEHMPPFVAPHMLIRGCVKDILEQQLKARMNHWSLNNN